MMRVSNRKVRELIVHDDNHVYYRTTLAVAGTPSMEEPIFTWTLLDPHDDKKETNVPFSYALKLEEEYKKYIGSPL